MLLVDVVWLSEMVIASGWLCGSIAYIAGALSSPARPPADSARRFAVPAGWGEGTGGEHVTRI